MLTAAPGSGMVCRRQIVTHFATIDVFDFDRDDRILNNSIAAAPLTVGRAGRTVLGMSVTRHRPALRLLLPREDQLAPAHRPAPTRRRVPSAAVVDDDPSGSLTRWSSQHRNRRRRPQHRGRLARPAATRRDGPARRRSAARRERRAGRRTSGRPRRPCFACVKRLTRRGKAADRSRAADARVRPAGLPLRRAESRVPRRRGVGRAETDCRPRGSSAAGAVDQRIPAGAGLGGGSSDGARALQAVNRLWRTDRPADELSAFAARFGSDLPLLPVRPEQRLHGPRGGRPPDRTAPAAVAVLVLPPVHMPTPDVYPRFDEMGLGRQQDVADEPDWAGSDAARRGPAPAEAHE